MPSPNVPNPESYEQLLGDALSSYASAQGISDFNVGSAVTSFFEVAALMTARASGDIFQILRDYSVTRATGSALQLLATENGITPITATPTTGFVTVTDLSFQVISTQIYTGTPAPNIGSTTIYVGNAEAFVAETPGNLYIGRGTPNVEGPLPFIVAPVQTGNYWTITLNAATTKYHNIGESVILAQGGNRSIPVNTIVVAPSIGANPAIQYAVTTAAVILDGATTVTNIPVTAQLPGSSGNIPIGTIQSFAANPSGLPNASVTNPGKFTTGTDNETDDSLRTRIMAKLSSIGLGTTYAIESAVIGATSSDEPNATVVSDDMLETSYGSVLFIDDGTLYEAKFAGVGLESIVTSAIGGEQYFQLATGGRQAPVTKAFLISTLSSPFDLVGGDSLALIVGETTYQHNFLTTDFRSPGSATAYEITASINGDSAIGFEAATSGNGSYVVVRPKGEGHDTIQTTTPVTNGNDASVQLGFPSSQYDTLRLYKNNVPLSEDGLTATVFTASQSLWSPAIAQGDTLILSVDGTAAITYTLENSDFIATGLYTSVSSSNSLASWVEVFNNKLTGVTAEIVGAQISLTSNLLANNRASVVINPGSTLVTKGMFSTTVGLSSQGKASDYTLDRNTAQIQLVTPLVAGDSLSAGSSRTEANITSKSIPTGAVTLSSSGYMWLLVDSPGEIILTGIISGAVLGVSKPSTNTVRYTAVTNPNAFSNVQSGDYVIIWSQDLPAADRLEGRVHAVTNTTLDIVVTPAEYAAIVPEAGVNFTQGFVVLRSQNAPQKFEVAAGTYTLDQLVTVLQAQSDQIVFAQELEEFLTATTNSNNPEVGSLLVVTSDIQGQLLNFTAGSSNVSQFSLLALYDSQGFDTLLPLFIHSTVENGTVAYPPDSFIQTFNSNVSLAGRSPNEIISFLQPYGIPNALTTTGNTVALSNQLTNLASTAGLSFGQFIVGAGIPLDTTVLAISGTTVTMSNNATANGTGITVTFNTLSADAQPYGEYAQESYPPPSGSAVNISYPNLVTESNLDVSRDIRRLRGTADGSSPVVADRYFVASPLDFGPNDTIVTVLDNNPTSETFDIPLYRIGLTNTGVSSNPSTFDAYDYSAGPTASFATTFGPDFDFSNFKVLLQAKMLLTPSPSNTSILYRATSSGSTGENIAVGYVYPTAPNTPIGSTVTVNELVTVLINLASGAAISSAINSTTEWNITITANTPTAGIDQVTYAWNGTGTSPGLTLSGGEYVNITTQTEFAPQNTGVFRVSTQSGFAPTSTQFTVQRPHGAAEAQSNVATQVNGAITFYSPSPTTANQILAYVNANLSQYFTASNATGSTGAGTIVLSTYEDSGFTYSTVSLQDGVNWIAVSDLDGSPQFTFKEPLAYPYDSAGYAFNNGEKIILSPTTMDQVNRFINVLAVTGFTTDGISDVVDRGSRLELSTQTLGSSGAVQVLGGLGNQYQVPVLYSANRINNQLMNVSVSNIAGQGIQSDQWFRLQASIAQAKETLVSSNTNVTVTPNSPSIGQSTIQLLNQNLTQRYFGHSRQFVTPSGATFKVEAQGSLVCISWTGVGSNPNFETAVNFNASGGGTLNVYNAPASTDQWQYTITSGAATFANLSINDLVTISGLPNPANNGTFLVTGVSNSGTTMQVLNPNGDNELSSGTFTVNTNPNPGDTVTIGSTVLTAVASSPTGNQFLIGGTTGATAINLSALAGTVPGVTSSVSGNIVTITAITPLATIALASSNPSHISVSGAFLAGDPYTGSTFSATTGVSEGDTVILTAPFNVLNQGQFRVIREYNNSIWIENSDMVPEEVALTSNSQMVFYEYESTVPGDKVVFTNNAFLPANVGSWVVVEVLSPSSAVVTGTMAAITNVSLNGIESSLFVQEGVPYSGYKHTLFTAPQPGSSTSILVTFDTNAQSDKIDQAGEVQMTSLNKLNFNTLIKLGLDSYRYNTGLIAEANRIIYGDPRDNTTYSGVGAAGTNIFVQEPLALRIQVSLAMRLNTGVPFAQTVIQVQDSVSSLINSNGLGEPISISSIVSAVQAIPGIISVVVTFPNYSVSNDLIKLAPGQKAFIIDPTTDITVALIGT